jgi:hypothetical protein
MSRTTAVSISILLRLHLAVMFVAAAVFAFPQLARAADNQRPTVSITSPATGSTLSGSVTLSASAMDNVGVIGVQFARNGVALGAMDASKPYALTVDTTQLANGTHTFTATAHDAAGNRRTSPGVTVTVANSVPTTQPYSGAPASVPGTIEAENFDNGGNNVGYKDNVSGNSGGAYRTAESVDIIASTDSLGGGYVVNNFETGEWLNYTISVASAGSYDIDLRASSAMTNSSFRLLVDGTDVSGVVTVPNTGGWSNFQWVGKKGVQLPAGTHVLRIVSSQQYFNLNSIRVAAAQAAPQPPAPPSTVTAAAQSPSRIDVTWNASGGGSGVAGYHVFRNGAQVASVPTTTFSSTGLAPATTYSYEVAAYDAAGNVSPRSTPAASATTPPLQSPFSGAAIALPGTFQAEDFDIGGQGVAYNDLSAGNSGGQYRAGEGVDIVLAPGTSGGYVVNSFQTGEWLSYTVSVPNAGNYDIALLASNLFAPTSAFHVEIDGVNVTGSVLVPLTAGWDDFKWVTRTGVPLTAGTHVLKVVSDQQYFNLDAVRVTATAAAPPPPSGSVLWSCTFPSSSSDCGFFEQAKVPGRATVVSTGRDGGTGIRLHTEPGDDNVAGSGTSERNDLSLSQAATDCYQGKEIWYAHSIYFPSDYVQVPNPGSGQWNWSVVFDFHNTTSGAWQANFHIDVMPEMYGGMRFRGYGGVNSGDGEYLAPIGPVVKNVWYDFVYHVKWSSGSDGYFDAWVNGVQKLAHRGPTIYQGQGCYMKLANYHTPFGQASSVIHDRVLRGTAAAAVSLTPLQGVP